MSLNSWKQLRLIFHKQPVPQLELLQLLWFGVVDDCRGVPPELRIPSFGPTGQHPPSENLTLTYEHRNQFLFEQVEMLKILFSPRGIFPETDA